MNTDKIIREWFYRLPKGYAEAPYTEKELEVLDSVLAEFNIKKPIPTDNVTVEQLDEAPAQKIGMSFEENLLQVFDNNIPEAVGAYQIKPGKFEIHKDDRESFKRLFKENAGLKDVGNGEVALYWLFNYSGGTAEENRGKDAPDLIINGDLVEVKSYPKHDKKINLGKFKNGRIPRTIITRLFGVQNLTAALGRGTAESPFVSEVNFDIDDLRASFESALELKKILDDDKVRNLLLEFDTFRTLDKELNYLIDLVPDGNAEELAKHAMAVLLDYKLQLKPGPGNYVLNLKSTNELDIYIHQIPVDIPKFLQQQDYDTFKASAGVASAELQIRFSIFE